MILVAATLAVLVFLMAFERFGVVKIAGRAIARSNEAAASLRDPSMTEEAREAALRGASVSLISDFFSIALRGALALGASVLPVLVMDLLGLVNFEATMRWLASWQAIVAISVVISLWYAARRK